MPAALSPLRYIQLARCVIQWWVDTAPMLAARRKAAQERAARLVYAPRLRALAAPSVAQMMLPEEQYQKVAAATAAQDRPASAAAITSALASPYLSTPDISLPPSNLPLSLPPRPRPDEGHDEIYRLMNDPRAFLPGAMQAPKEIVVLCHGLYGFSTATPIPLFPSLKLHYWASVLEVLRRMGAKVVVVGVKGTGSIQERADQMHKFLKDYLPKGVGVNFVAHSMGGLDCRHLISNIRPTEYTPLSLTTIATPHRGSPFMDWCAANIGVGATLKSDGADLASVSPELPFSLKSPILARLDPRTANSQKEQDAISSFTSALTNYLLSIFDTPAYNCLRTSYLRDEFNPATPDDPNVKYMSVAGRVSKMSVLHPLWFPKLVLDSAAERGYPALETPSGDMYQGNDGLVSVASSKWGEFMGVVDGCHHWDLRGEGGLWPQAAAMRAASTGRPDAAMPGGWNWESEVGLETGGAGGMSDPQLQQVQHDKDLATARAMAPVPGTGKRESSWDLATVGALVDWVGDLFPGDKKEQEPTHQYRDAKREMAATSTGTSTSKSSSTDAAAPRPAVKIVREKFDLARFYGGLMLRLREDGL